MKKDFWKSKYEEFGPLSFWNLENDFVVWGSKAITSDWRLTRPTPILKMLWHNKKSNGCSPFFRYIVVAPCFMQTYRCCSHLGKQSILKSYLSGMIETTAGLIAEVVSWYGMPPLVRGTIFLVAIATGPFCLPLGHTNHKVIVAIALLYFPLYLNSFSR